MWRRERGRAGLNPDRVCGGDARKGGGLFRPPFFPGWPGRGAGRRDAGWLCLMLAPDRYHPAAHHMASSLEMPITPLLLLVLCAPVRHPPVRQACTLRRSAAINANHLNAMARAGWIGSCTEQGLCVAVPRCTAGRIVRRTRCCMDHDDCPEGTRKGRVCCSCEPMEDKLAITLLLRRTVT
jgi:hypothetical protein